MKDMLVKPVQFLKRVGPKRVLLLQKINILTIGDLLYHFPREYLDRTGIIPAYTAAQGQLVTVAGRVLHAQELKPRQGLNIVKLAIDDGHSVFSAVWFNQKYAIKQYPPGTLVLVSGKAAKNYRGTTQIQVQECEAIDSLEQVCREKKMLPMYPLTEGISQKAMRQLVQNAIEQVQPLLEFIPRALLTKYRLPVWEEALNNIHSPKNNQSVHQARRRLVFEEFFLMQLTLAKRRQKMKRHQKKHKYQAQGQLVAALLNQLPFKPTSDQIKVWQEIQRDMNSAYPMNRLLQGDVGSGKTLISALMLVKAVAAGWQGALMAPTEILAEQHYTSLSLWFKQLGINCCVLTGSLKKNQREKILNDLRQGKIQVLIGTHALIQKGVDFQQLAAVVVDEQHRFGVKQRLALLDKGHWPDMLVMTATPIPRTLALTAYGDLDISVIESLPPGRQPVRTHQISHQSVHDLYRLISREAQQGRQSYLVCPLVAESAVLDVQNVVDLAAEVRGFAAEPANIFQGLNIGLLHGRLKVAEKEKVISQFHQGEIDVLVSTTVIEVGVDVPNATVMAIIDADRFGLAQLHQLRGRVGRGKHRSYCILVAAPKTNEAKQRLAAMVNTSDGFVLAEEDLRLRGPGDFLGTKQSGLPEFKIADIIKDRQALVCARQEATALVQKDPEFKQPEQQLLVPELQRRFVADKSLLN